MAFIWVPKAWQKQKTLNSPFNIFLFCYIAFRSELSIAGAPSLIIFVKKRRHSCKSTILRSYFEDLFEWHSVRKRKWERREIFQPLVYPQGQVLSPSFCLVGSLKHRGMVKLSAFWNQSSRLEVPSSSLMCFGNSDKLPNLQLLLSSSVKRGNNRTHFIVLLRRLKQKFKVNCLKWNQCCECFQNLHKISQCIAGHRKNQ